MEASAGAVSGRRAGSVASVRRRVAAALLAGGATVGLAVASGTLCLPRALVVQGKTSTREDIQKGKELFSGRSVIGAKGKTCLECHNDPNRLSQSAIAPKKEQLTTLINACLTHPDRGTGKELACDSGELFCLQAWLMFRYRLEAEK